MNSAAEYLAQMYELGSYYHDRPVEAWGLACRRHEQRALDRSRELAQQIAQIRGQIEQLKEVG